MAEPGADVVVPLPSAGRCFEAERLVRFGDTTATGRLRLDAVATYAQDVASDDTAATIGGTDSVWIVRRTLIELHESPRYGETLRLQTWCGGLGSRWAERRVRMTGDRGGHIEVASVWVHTVLGVGRPAPLTEAFAAAYSEAAGGREVSARLRLPSGPDESAAVVTAPWAVRHADLDLLGHVNNAASWQAVEEVLGDDPPAGAFRAELEHRDELRREPITLRRHGSAGDPAGVSLWLTRDTDGGVPVAARVRALG